MRENVANGYSSAYQLDSMMSCDKNNRVAHGEQQICRCVTHASLQNAFFDDVNYASIFREIIDRNQSNRLYNSAYHVNLIGLEVRGQSD